MIGGMLIRATRGPRYALSRMTYACSSQHAALRELRGRYAGQPMVVVGNGPSLNETPLDQFADVPSIGMNKIDLIFPRTSWRPKMILATNPTVTQQHRDIFPNLGIPVYLSWKNRWFMRQASRYQCHYFRETLSDAFSTDISQGVGSQSTVTYACLQFAYYMGANPVVLFGVDHNFSKSTTKIQYEKREGPDVNHFDPNYFKAGSVWGVPNLEGSEIAYHRAHEAFRADNRQIFDATIGGKLQVYPKISLAEAVRICHEQSPRPAHRPPD